MLDRAQTGAGRLNTVGVNSVIGFRLRMAACLAAAILGLAGPGAAAAYSAPPVPQQHQQALHDLDQTRARILADSSRLSELDTEIAAKQAAIADRRRNLAGVARLMYKQPPSPLVVMASSGSLLQALQGLIDFNQVGIVARTDRSRVIAAGRELDGLRQTRSGVDADLQAQEGLLRLELVQVSSLEIWDRVSIWQLANHDFKIDPSPGHTAPNRFLAPLPGAVLTQGFGPTTAWFEPPYGGAAHFHTGIDLAAPWGTPVHAADDAVVLFTGSDGYGYGNYVVLGHSGGLVTLYGHLASIAVKQGDQLKQGDVIGAEGSTGNSTGAHLHFELRVDGTPTDPRPLLAGA